MPTYEYKCGKCGKKFELMLSFKEHERKRKCPKCGSSKVEQLVCSFTAVTSKKA